MAETSSKMSLEMRKVTPVELRSLGLDEKWLQEQIKEDPSLLGLGELEIAGREHRQPAGGRIDFLMRDVEAETYYEVEIMLGALDETHIIRTIEYWDIERQRRPQFEHRAVIVAEEITARFFNVLRLMNRAVPMIAVKLSAFRMDDSLVLHPVTVLDVFEEVGEVETGEVEQVDRGYWEKKSAPASLAMVDKVLSMLQAQGIQPRVTYNRYHIAVGTTGRNFCWLRPRRTPGNCHIEFRVIAETRDSVLLSLQSAGIDASRWGSENIAFRLTSKSLEEQSNLLIGSLTRAEEASRL
jgi:hypothetical protein